VSQVTATAPPLPAVRRRRPDTGRTGIVLAGTLVTSAIVACLAGAASIVHFAYPAVAITVAMGLLLRARWYSYLAFTIIMWLLSHEMRRIVDWQTTYHEFSPVSITGSVVSLLALPWALRARRHAYRDVAAVMTVALVVLAYGFVLGVLRNGPAPALADVLYLVAPLATGLFVLTVPADDYRLRRVVEGIALWGTALLGTYAIVQFLLLPPWDEAWIVDSQVGNLGNAAPGEFRAFSTVSTTGPLGQVLAAFLLLLLCQRRLGRQLPIAAVGLVALGITLVRAGWVGLAIGVVVLMWLGRARVWRLVALVALMLLALISVGGPIYDSVSARASETAEAGAADTSLVARLSFQAEVAPQTLSDPIGDGMGATGVSTDVAEGELANERFRNFDSGLFETLTRYGVLAGSAMLAMVFWTCARIMGRARSGTIFDAACAAAIAALTVGLLFTDTLRALYGVVLWTLIGVQGRPRLDRNDTAANEAGRTR
jgi:putative inorganic carbon (HCO3(-)) transporter